MTSKIRRVELVNKTFTTYKCSVLHGFTPTQPKQRTRTIKALQDHLCTQFDLIVDNKNEEEEQTEEGNVLKKIELRRFRVDGWESSCPFMELRVAIKFENEDHISMTTVSMIPNQEQSSNKEYASYPLLLVRGKARVWKEIASWMHWSFHCNVSRLEAPPSILEPIVKWCAERLVNSVEEGKEDSKKFELGFMVKYKPKEDPFDVSPEPTIDPFTFPLSIEDIKKNLAIVKESSSELSFIDVIPKEKYIKKNVKISDLIFILIKLGSPIVHIDVKDNRLKFLAGTSKPDLVQVLQELCQVASLPSK